MKFPMHLFRFTILVFLSQVGGSLGCVTIASESYGIIASSEWNVYKGAIQAGLDSNKGIMDYSPPKQIRSWLGVMASAYTAMAWCQKSALDFFGRKSASETNRRCTATSFLEQRTLDDHALEAFSYSFLWALQIFVPEWSSAIDSYASRIGADLSKCPSESPCDTNTAAGLARKVVEDVTAIFERDGWNADGLFTREQNVYPFEDWRPDFYHPNLSQLCLTQWRTRNELCKLRIEYGEDVCYKEEIYQISNQEYFYALKYHMPHLGDSARSYFLGNEYICEEFKLSYPCYDLKKESEEVLSRSYYLDDSKKARIEYFDDQFLWFNFFLTEHFDSDFVSSSWEIVKDITAVTAAMYESTIVVWKEKLENGAVRPKTYINREYDGVVLQAYRGPEFKDSGPINGEDWVPYIADEPTPEYPSHIACMCSAFSSIMERLTGSNIKGDGSGISVIREAGSSTVEVGKPDEQQTFQFSTWSSLEAMCHESRRNSGTHFSKSVEVAMTTCKELSSSVIKSFLQLTTGIVPDFVIDSETLPLQVRRCDKRGSNVLESIGIQTASSPITSTVMMNFNENSVAQAFKSTLRTKPEMSTSNPKESSDNIDGENRRFLRSSGD